MEIRCVVGREVVVVEVVVHEWMGGWSGEVWWWGVVEVMVEARRVGVGR